MGKLYEEKWYQKLQKNNKSGQNSRGYTGTGTGLYRYTPSRMQTVPVHVQAVPVQVCPKCPDCVIFAYLSLNSYTVSIGLLND